MVDLELTRLGDTNYQARVTRIVGGFSNPIDAEILSNKVYVIEYSGNQGIWEVTFPAAAPPIILSQPVWLAGGAFGFNVSGAAGRNYQIAASTNLLDWSLVTNVVATNNQFEFVDPSATNYPQRFYRVNLP